MNSARRLVLLSLLLVATAAATPTPVKFHLGWFPSAQFAGVFVALDRGFYADAGLDVEIVPFAYGLDTPATLAATSEVCALASIEGYILLQKRERGHDLVALAPMLHSSPAGFMSLASENIRSVRDFAGQRIGVHAYAEKLFAWFVADAGLEPTRDAVTLVPVDDDISHLISGDVAAMQGYASEEYVRLQAAVAPQATKFLSFGELGFDSYSEILYTTRNQIAAHPDTLAAFVRATRQGWIAAFAAPERAVQAVLTRSPASTDPAHVAAALTALKPYVLDSTGNALPQMKIEKWQALTRVSAAMGLISDATTNDPTSWLWPPSLQATPAQR